MSHLGKGRDRGGAEIVVGAAGEEVAHVRARFAVDPAMPARLADAWKVPTGTVEEDESEFVDAVADCLSVGLPIDAAVASWRAGTLEVASSQDHEDDDEEDEDTGVFDDAETGIFDPRNPSPRRRVVTS
jgi:hypothetical protein